MKKTLIELPEMTLVGVAARTSNAAEMNPETAKIGATIQKFFGESLQEKILTKKNPERFFSVYHKYASDFRGDYTYFYGQEVTSLHDLSTPLEAVVIPSQIYMKFTSDPGVMPHVVIDMWQKIWEMTPADLGSERAYQADFEIYDGRSLNPQSAVVDIYVGIKH